MLGTSLLRRSTVAFAYFKVKSAKYLCLLPVVLVLSFCSWSWSCYFGLGRGLGLKNVNGISIVFERAWGCECEREPHGIGVGVVNPYSPNNSHTLIKHSVSIPHHVLCVRFTSKVFNWTVFITTRNQVIPSLVTDSISSSTLPVLMYAGFRCRLLRKQPWMGIEMGWEGMWMVTMEKWEWEWSAVMGTGFLRGSVLSPTLFNLYTNDLPVTGSRKFIYADDVCLTKQAQRYAELECSLIGHGAYGLILPPLAA